MKQDGKFKDFEDTLQYVLAKNQRCELILTKDEGFYSPTIKTLSSEGIIRHDDSKTI